jgi:hypothetical protein
MIAFIKKNKITQAGHHFRKLGTGVYVISKLQPLFDIDYHLVFQGLQILA